VNCASSGVQFCTIKMTMEEFANAISNLSYRPCGLELMGLEDLGKDIEVKTEPVFVPKKVYYFSSRGRPWNYLNLMRLTDGRLYGRTCSTTTER